MARGLESAADQLASYGRGKDTLLAHISPDEAKFIDVLQGGRRTNPMTGLPEYGLFGKILKSIARAGAGVAGFVLSGGNPLAAAAASAAVTKLTGGSWKQSLKAGAFSGIGAGVGNLAASGGNAFFSNAALSGGLGGAGAGAAEGGLGSAIMAAQQPGTLGAAISAAGGAAAPAAAGGVGALLAPIGGYAGAAAGLGAYMGGQAPPGAPPPLTQPQQPGINLDVLPYDRGYQGYFGDFNHYGEGIGHQFFKNVNPVPQLRANATPAPVMDQQQLEQTFMARGGRVRGYALGGGVLGPQGPGMMAGPQTPQLQAPGGLQVPGQGVGMGTGQQDQLRRVQMLGMLKGMAKGGKAHAPPSPAAMAGVIHGPGGPREDLINAQLSDGEHVIDSASVTAAGGGSNARGHKVIEKFKQDIRKNAGIAHPKKAPSARAMKRAGFSE